MTGKIYSSFLLSLLFHGIFLVALLVTIKQSVSTYSNLNLTYVSLIEESANSATSQVSTPLLKEESAPQIQVTQKKEATERTQRVSKLDEQRLEERVAALRAKKNLIERHASDTPSSGTLEVSKSEGSRVEAVSASYLGLISGLIRKNWSIPETVPKNLEAVVSVRILSNGQIIVEGFEKSSGNTLFDSSVLKALRNSSPLPPPKTEVIVGLRFKP